MKRKVISAFFQSAITAPGVLGGEPSLSATKHRGIEMYQDGDMLLVYYKGTDIGVPLMNVKSMVFEPQSTIAPLKSKLAN